MSTHSEHRGHVHIRSAAAQLEYVALQPHLVPKLFPVDSETDSPGGQSWYA